jgi:oxygen-independent coproporphyrinogen-3 oxidase
MSRKKPSSPCSRSPTEGGALGLYVHIPFCASKCAYCDFASVPLDDAGGMSAARRYLEALFIEIDRRAVSAEFHGAPARTVYLGGGTPTILPRDWIAELLTRLRHRFPFEADAEISIEANPGTVDEETVATLLAAGINRFSLGVQSFSDDVLHTLGRVHSASEAREAISAARTARCTNLNLDLMFGIPEQSMEEWQDTLAQAADAQPEHVSLYALSVEPGTPLACGISAGDLPPPDDDLAAGMYETAHDMLTHAGFEHYEISNFAREGSQCRHNRIYWADEEYLGLGASSHSFRNGVRWNVARAETLSASERVGEMLILGLRRAEGVTSAEIAARCGSSPEELFGEEIAQLRQEGMLLAEDGALRVPREKWLVSNEVLLRFVG